MHNLAFNNPFSTFNIVDSPTVNVSVEMVESYAEALMLRLNWGELHFRRLLVLFIKANKGGEKMKRILCALLVVITIMTPVIPAMAAIEQPSVSPQYTYISTNF